MKCNRVKDIIHEYVDCRMAQRDCDEVEAHIESCPDCAAEVESVRSLVHGLGGLCGCRSPVDCWDSIRSRLPAAGQRAPAWRRWSMRPVFAVPAAAVALLLAVFLLIPGFVGQKGAVASTPQTEYTKYLNAHSHAQSRQAFADPDVALAAAEMESARITECSLRK